MTTPKLWFAQHIDKQGRTHSLAVVVTHDGSLGSCIYEMFGATTGSDSNVANGEWHVTHGDEYSQLVVTFPDSCEVPDAELDILCADLVDQGLADTFAPMGG